MESFWADREAAYAAIEAQYWDVLKEWMSPEEFRQMCDESRAAVQAKMDRVRVTN